MNPLLARLGQVACRRQTTELILDEFRESYPVLSEIMAGVEGGEGVAGVPALTLLLFWEGSQLKCRIGRHKHPWAMWLTIDDPVKALDCIERALAAGKADIRPAKQY